MAKKILAPAIVIIMGLLPSMASAQGAPKQDTAPAKAAAPSEQPAQAKPASEPVPKPADAAPPPAAATGQTPAQGALGAEELKAVEDAYSIKLKGLEEKVNELKEKVFRSKARLLLLQETVLTGKISSAKINVIHKNELGYFFALESVAYTLDGAPIFNKLDQGNDLNRQKEFEVLPISNLVAGTHNLSAFVVIRGSGHGFFSYMDGYKFKLKSAVNFTTEEGKITRVRVIPFEKGGLTVDVKDRPSIRFEVEMKADIEEKKSIK